MKNIIKKVFGIIMRRKLISAIIAAVLIIGGYFGIKALNSQSNETRYVLGTVEKGTVSTSVSGTGQVSALNQVDITPKTSGDIISVAAKAGQEVKKGDLIAQIDATDALQDLKSAQVDLELAQIALEQANISAEDSEADVEKTYEETINTIVGTFSDFSDVMDGLREILFGTTVDNQHWNLSVYQSYHYVESDPLYEKDVCYQSYQAAKSAYEDSLDHYGSLTRNSDKEEIEELLEEIYQVSKKMAEASKDASNLVQTYKNYLDSQSLTNSTVNGYITDLGSYTNTSNSLVVSLFSAQQTLKSAKNIDSTTLKTKTFAVEQKQNSLTDAQETLSDCYIRSSIDGVVAEVNIEIGDAVSTSTSAATVITKKKMAEISLNEVDAAQVEVGQKVMLTFDAIEDLTIAGEVTEVDTIGTVSQGVVSYNVKVVFDTEDERIKIGMSTSATIITDIKQDVLVISNSAVKTSNDINYVEMPEQTISSSDATNSSKGVTIDNIKQQVIEIGLTNDSYAEIVSGLSEGDQVIIKTISSSSKSSSSSSSSSSKTTSSQSLFQMGGGMGGGPPQ